MPRPAPVSPPLIGPRTRHGGGNNNVGVNTDLSCCLAWCGGGPGKPFTRLFAKCLEWVIWSGLGLRGTQSLESRYFCGI